MARGGDTRSPSPAGSYSSSRRHRKDDERAVREKRDDARYGGRRSQSPGGDRRYRDRDYRRGYRSPDLRGGRREADTYRSSRRARSRERSRDRAGGRDRRNRSRERDYRDRRDDSRDRHKRRRDDSADSKRRARREDGRDVDTSRPTPVGQESSKQNKTAKSEEEKKKAERLAKLEAWKQKQKLKEAETRSSTPNASTAADSKGPSSPVITAPHSPSTPNSDASPAPYAGKFDPKAIAKKAAEKTAARNALGDDIAVLQASKTSATSSSSTIGLQANQTKGASASTVSGPSDAGLLKASGNVGGFGLSKSNVEAEKAAHKRTLDFGEEESTRKRLEKLPTPPPEDKMIEDAMPANGDEKGDGEDGEDGEDDDNDIQDASTDDENDAAARAAAEERKERALAQGQEQQNGNDGSRSPQMEMDSSTDVVMGNGLSDVNEEEKMEVEEDIDPLDAFMSNLDDLSKAPKAPGLSTAVNPQSKKQEPEVLLSDEEELTAVGTNTDDILNMASKARKKKDIPAVNHAKMNYDSFRKNFYTEPAELAEMREEEVADLRLELDGIKARGLDVPKPVQKWSQCGLGAQTLEVVQKLGFEKPTSIQSQAIPAIMSGRDVIGIAKTGSGKTIAFLLPMFRHIKDQRPLDSLDGPIGLIMTPTRELATQIHKECRPWLKALNLRAVCAYGGAPIKDQIADLKRGTEIIVCTPGRMIDLLAANAGRVTNLRRVTYVVLDEADRMFDMGFEPQVMKIMANIRPQRQTVLFSATFPTKMEQLARKTLVKPVEIIVGGRSVVAPEIKQIVEVRTDDTKFLRLLKLLGDIHENEDGVRSLIFVDRQESAEDLMNNIMRRGYPCFTIHGGKDQFDRDSVISDYKNGIFPVLVATSVAARGLDVKELKLVVNYDCPNHLEDYVHRAGRTGRAGNTGLAVTFITPDQGRYAVDVAKALRQSGQDVPEEVQKLVDSFLAKVKEGKEKASGSGFGGKGLERLDQERDATRNRERKTFKTGDEPDEEETKDDKDVGEEDKIVVKSSTAVAIPAETTAPIPSSSLPGVPKHIDLDGAITVHRTETPAAGTVPPKDRDSRISSAAAAINNRLMQENVIRPSAPIDNKGPDAGAFHATLEINDFPQKARWAVTNRTNVAKILEATGTSITTKGNYYKEGAVPAHGEAPKLYILVEGDTEVVVTGAMRELMRLLKEGTAAAVEGENRGGGGRYTVV